ncbi:MAG: ATP-dependent Clp protease ATP-binding subunit [Clostridia bacterium]|nr:ATP-dependent Clp protease ATP-binding subunit [Clostridia bacterium]
MQMCSRCHKRMAVLFITKIENNETKNEGLCLKCARELGIPQVDNILSGMGLSDEDLENMESEMEDLLSASGADDDESEDDEAGESRTPALDLAKIFGNLPFMKPPTQSAKSESGDKKEEKTGAKDSKDDKKKSDKKADKKSARNRKFLDTYCRDLTRDAREGKLDAVIGRERETARVMQILSRRQKNNPCLIGEPGVGKTAIAEALAQRIAEGNVPYRLRGKEVHLVDLTALVAGTQFRGQFESRMKSLIDEVKALGNIILVIDEVHSIVGVGDSEGSMNAANILKPALSRGEIQLIGATTLNEYRKYIEKDSALERRFQPVIVEEPSLAETKKILAGIKRYYEAYHKIHISDDIIHHAVELSERYITDRFLPDKAIDLLDEAAAHVAINSPVLDRINLVEEELRRLKASSEEIEQETLPDPNDHEAMSKHYEKVASLRASQLQNEQEFERLKEQMATVCLTLEDLARVIEIWTGVPSGSITANEFERLRGLEGRLKERIVGQDTAVSAVCRAIKRNRAGVSYKKKPASFIFAGPTGVGKTELVKVLAEDLFDTPDALIRLDMSEFMEKHSVSRIVGSPPGYVGYDEAGQLTEKIRRKPYAVILFDEIEKAHPDVLNVLLQILDDGQITDAHGRKVNFENTIIVMTSNAGSATKEGTVGFDRTSTQQDADRAMKALQQFLRPEFINRVDAVITFNRLSEEHFQGIARIMLEELVASLKDKAITFTYDDALVEFLTNKSYSRTYGARNLRRTIQKELEDPMATKIIDSYEHPISQVKATAEDGAVKLYTL